MPITLRLLPLEQCQAGTAKNIIAEEAYMTGTMRYYDNDLLDTLGTAALRIIPPRLSGRRQRWRSFPACLPLSTILSYPSCPQRWLSTCLAADALFSRSAQLAVDDFAYYAEKAPSLYAWVGAKNEEKIPYYPHHNPRFDIDERCMEQTIAYFTGFALSYLKDEKGE